MKTRNSMENKREELQLNQESLGFEWLELTTIQHLQHNETLVSDEKLIRKGIKLNHNETLVSDEKLIRKGIKLNHNETLVSDGKRPGS